jgi:hypothetical protein
MRECVGPSGDYRITVDAFDIAGNGARKTITVTIKN